MSERAVEILPSAPSDADLLLCSRWGVTYPQLLAERATAVVFRFPMPRPLTNASGRSRHWRTINRERAMYFRECDIMQACRQLPPPPAEPWPRARMQTRMILGGAMDDDNASARCKWAVDWIDTRGYIANDRKTCLVRDGYPEQRVTRKEAAHIIITLTRPSA